MQVPFPSLRAFRRSRLGVFLTAPYYTLKVFHELRRYSPAPDPFLDASKGVIHVGAQRGQERYDYAKRKLRVLWVEADPDMIPHLRANLRGFPQQHCIQGLVGSCAEPHCRFYVANNDGASSSVFPFERHGEIWPEIRMDNAKFLRKYTLPELLEARSIPIGGFDTLVMDCQGSELDILRGIPRLSERFRRIQLETSDFPVYRGAPLKPEIDAHLFSLGYQLMQCSVFATGGQQKNCMDCRYVLAGYPGPA